MPTTLSDDQVADFWQHGCIAATDALPLVPNHIPSAHMGMILSGQDTSLVRSTAFELQKPVIPETTLFDQQTQKAG